MDLFLNNDSFITIDLDPEDSDGGSARTRTSGAEDAHADIAMQTEVESVEEVERDEEVGLDEPVELDEEAEFDEEVEAVESGEPDEEVGLDEPIEPVVTIVNPRRVPRINPVNLDSEVDKYEMYQDVVSSSNTLGVGLVILMLVIAIMVAMWVGFGFIAGQVKEQSARTLRDSIMDTAMQCFAIEGSYPPSLAYLQDNYGLSINEEDYRVVYVASASNVPPKVDVRLR